MGGFVATFERHRRGVSVWEAQGVPRIVSAVHVVAGGERGINDAQGLGGCCLGKTHMLL
jgi:hypothetical protein